MLPVVREKSIVQHEPPLSVALDVVGPLEEPTSVFSCVRSRGLATSTTHTCYRM